MNNTILIALVVLAAVALLLLVRSLAGGDQIDSERAHELVDGGAQLVDVRTPNEYSSGHIEGATNIPVSDVAARSGELDKSRPVVVYCRSGARSSRAASTLQNRGFEVHNLGPMSAW